MDLNKLVQENLIISLVIIITPIVAIVWKIMYTLFIEPREFRIKTLEQDSSKLRDELLRIKKQSSSLDNQRNSSNTEIAEVNTINNISNLPIGNYSLKELYESWNNKNLTELQRKKLEETITGKVVIWEVYVNSISKPDNFNNIVIGISEEANETLQNNAIAYFNSKYEDSLSIINKGDKIKIEGTIERFFLSPIIKDCKLITRIK